MVREPSIRASDADRDRVAGILREHFAEGRLTIDEFHQRLDGIYASKTYGDLDRTLVDLPRPWDLAAPGMTPVLMRRSPQRRAERFRRGWPRFLAVNGLCWSVWALEVMGAPHHDPGLIWPLFVTVPWTWWRVRRMRVIHESQVGRHTI